MNTDSEKILFQFEGEKIISYSNFVSQIENALSDLVKSKRKLIVVCIIELMQNALKYKSCGKAKLTISIDRNIEICFINNADNPQSLKLKAHFERIEKIGVAKLKEMLRRNLDSPEKVGNTGAGNGLIKCMLKSDKRMQLLINNISENKKQIIIKIFFDHE